MLMAERREFVVYLSSTFKDMEREREAAISVIRRHAVVLDSCRASEDGTVKTCTGDVRKTSLYIGVIGQRYGFVPKGADNPAAKSITELEYDACRVAGEKPIDRLIFIRTKNDDEFNDALADDEAAAKGIKAFRKRATDEQQPYPFGTIEQFREALGDAIRDAADKFHSATDKPIFAGEQAWKNELKPVTVGVVPGTDTWAAALLTRDSANRFQAFDLSPDDPAYLGALDAGISQGQLTCLLLTPASLQRLNTAPGREKVRLAIDTMQVRNGIAVLLCAGLDPASLPPEWSAARPLAWSATQTESRDETAVKLEHLFSTDLRSLAPDLTTQPRLALPWLVLAPTREEVLALAEKDGPVFAGFTNEEDRELRRKGCARLIEAVQKHNPAWPETVYGETRHAWRCFGPDSRSAAEIVTDAVRRINTALPGSRERRLLRKARIVLRRYRLEEFLDDRFGSRLALQSICDQGCVVIVDELALVHPVLRKAGERLLAGERSAIVSVSACDPTHSPIRDLLSGSSYLRVASLIDRFSTRLDPRCEIAVNSVERCERWLSVAIPELIVTSQAAEARSELLGRMDDELRV